MRPHSAIMLDGPDRAPSRAMLYPTGFKKADFKKPIIGIAQTGSDLSPCNRHHIELSKRVRDGITAAGGTTMEIPVHPIQETGKRPTASLDRNLAEQQQNSGGCSGSGGMLASMASSLAYSCPIALISMRTVTKLPRRETVSSPYRRFSSFSSCFSPSVFLIW